MKVGIIGCGGIAPLHIGAFQRLENVEVVSLCDLSLEKAKNLATKYKIEKTYSDYWDMFEKEDLDLVDICTPTSTHGRIVIDASKAVPAILVEKPMARDVKECDQMINELEKNGTKICIGHSKIFHPNIQKAKSLVDTDNFDLFSFRTTLKGSYEILRKHDLIAPWTVLPEQKGIIWEVCSHPSYLQLFFMPDISEVYALGGKVKYSVYDDFAVLLRTKEERFGIIEISWLCKEPELIYELKDSKGRRVQVQWEFDYMAELSQYPPMNYGGVLKNFYVDEKRLLHKWARFAYQYFNKRKRLPIVNLLSKYVESIKKDLPSPVTAEDGRNTVHLLESIEKSLDEKRPISIKNI